MAGLGGMVDAMVESVDALFLRAATIDSTIDYLSCMGLGLDQGWRMWSGFRREAENCCAVLGIYLWRWVMGLESWGIMVRYVGGKG
jgi:hypothetical protein